MRHCARLDSQSRSDAHVGAQKPSSGADGGTTHTAGTAVPSASSHVLSTKQSRLQ
jgi:hypothetical protein